MYFVFCQILISVHPYIWTELNFLRLSSPSEGSVPLNYFLLWLYMLNITDFFEMWKYLLFFFFFTPVTCASLCLQSVPVQTHTQTVPLSLEDDPLAGCPRWLWAVCSGGTGTWMNDLEISLFQVTGVQKWSCKPGLLCLLRSIHWNKKRDKGEGGGGEGGRRFGPTQLT